MPNNWTWAGAPYDPRYGMVRADERAQRDNVSISAEQSLYGVQHQTYQAWAQQGASPAVLTTEILNDAANRVIQQGWSEAYDRLQSQRILEALSYPGILVDWNDSRPVFYPMPKLKTKSKLPAWF